MTIDIRLATKKDSSTLQKLMVSTFDEAFKYRSTPEHYDSYIATAFNTEQVLKELRTPQTQYYIAWDGTEAIGYLYLRQDRPRTDLKTKQQMEIQRLYIQKAWWGKAIGSQFMDLAEKKIKALGGGWLWLVVWTKNHEAIAFYNWLGFEQYAIQDFQFGGEIHHDPVMRLWVEQD